MRPPTRPAGQFAFNRASPQARGLLRWWTAENGTIIERVYGQPLARQRGDTTQRGSSVVGSILDPASGGAGADAYFAEPSSIPMTNTGPLSFSAWFAPNSTSAAQSLWGQRDAAALFWFEYRGDIDGGIFSKFSSDSDPSSGNLSLVVGEPVHVAATWNAGAIVFYKNGVQFASTTDSFSNATAMDQNPPYVLQRNNGGGPVASFIGAQMADIRIAVTLWTPSDVWDQYVNRWDLYRVPERRIFFDGSAPPPVGRVSRLALMGAG